MTTQSLDVLGLSPNQNYIVKVFATYTDPSGVVHVSDYSPPLQISAPSLSASGANITTSNYGTDIQLAGGSLFAGNFPSNVGQIDLTTTSPNGTGVIVSQTGIGAWNSGTQQFFLNAKTGAATFAGTITSPSLQSANYSASLSGSEPKYSVAGTFIDLTNGAISAPQFRITSAGSAYFGGDVSGAAYSGVNLATWAGGIAQTAANGKNTVGYGPITGLSGTTSGYGPNGTIYYVTGGTPVFPSTISYSGANQQKGDTFFSYNTAGNIIAQYTATNGSSWSKTLISSQTISELDVGKLTAGTINVAISLTAATIIGGLIENSGYSSVTDGSAFSTSGMAINLANSTITAPQFRIDLAGNAVFGGSVTANATINGTLASTVVSNAVTGVSAYTIATNALKMSGDSIVNASGQISVVNTNGTTFYSGSSATAGARTLVNSLGILGFDATSTNNATGRTFALSSSDGSLSLKGAITTGSTITGSTITGGSIYGGTIQTTVTPNSGNYISMSTNHAISFYSNTTAYAHITPLVSGGATYGLVMHQGATADSTGGSYPQIFIGNGVINVQAANGNYVSVNTLGVSINGGSVGVKLAGTLTPSSTPTSIVMGGGFSGNIFQTALNIQAVASGVPTGGNPGDIWLQY